MGKLKIDYKGSLLNAQKYIAQLERENAELKTRESYVGEINREACELQTFNEVLEKKLAQAKEIIKEFVCHYNNKTIYVNNVKPLLEQAEQFIKEIEK